MSRIDACYAHLIFSPCAVGALLKQDSIGAAGIPWRLRHSCHPTQLARNSVHKCPKPTSRGHFRRFVYTPTASFRAAGLAVRGLQALAQPPPQPGGGLLERICPVGPLFIVPRRLAGGCAPRLPGNDVTERRSLRCFGSIRTEQKGLCSSYEAFYSEGRTGRRAQPGHLGPDPTGPRRASPYPPR